MVTGRALLGSFAVDSSGMAPARVLVDRSISTDRGRTEGNAVKKLIVLAGLAAIGFVVYRQFVANKAEEDLWQEASAPADLA